MNEDQKKAMQAKHDEIKLRYDGLVEEFRTHSEKVHKEQPELAAQAILNDFMLAKIAHLQVSLKDCFQMIVQNAVKKSSLEIVK